MVDGSIPAADQTPYSACGAAPLAIRST